MFDFFPSLFVAVKLIVYAGTPIQDHSDRVKNTAEVIDILNENMECDPYNNGHNTNIIGSSGGKVNDEYIYCGGSQDMLYKDVTKICRILGKGFPGDPFASPLNLTIPEGRVTSNGGVILPNGTLFIAGNDNSSYLKSF